MIHASKLRFIMILALVLLLPGCRKEAQVKDPNTDTFRFYEHFGEEEKRVINMLLKEGYKPESFMEQVDKSKSSYRIYRMDDTTIGLPAEIYLWFYQLDESEENRFIGYKIIISKDGVLSEEETEKIDSVIQTFVERYQHLYAPDLKPDRLKELKEDHPLFMPLYWYQDEKGTLMDMIDLSYNMKETQIIISEQKTATIPLPF